MIKGIGIDIVEIDRIRHSYEKYRVNLLDKVFTPEEIEYAFSKKDPIPSLAVRFAAKEALTKALKVGSENPFHWQDASVELNSTGCPFFSFSDHLGSRLGNSTVHLSLSHSDKYATAVVIIE